jgi:hypothetical protein
VLLVIGAAIGSAFARETTFSLLPGDQALLDAARPGFTDALRLDGLEAEFGPDERPTRLDTTVTFLRDGAPVEQQLVQVNQPGTFGGYLVHAWQYGPAARLRVASLAGRPLLDGLVPLDERVGGLTGKVVELPSIAQSVGIQLLDDGTNRLEVSLADAQGVVDSGRIAPGEVVRLGSVEIRHAGLDAYVTFLSRSDPGMALLFAGAALVTGGMAVAFWLPRRRAMIGVTPGGLRLSVRGERLDVPDAEMQRLRRCLADAGIGH